MPQFQLPNCPHCRSEMTLTRIEGLSARITSGPPNYDLRTYKCPRCTRVLRKAVKLESAIDEVSWPIGMADVAGTETTERSRSV